MRLREPPTTTTQRGSAWSVTSMAERQLYLRCGHTVGKDVKREIPDVRLCLADDLLSLIHFNILQGPPPVLPFDNPSSKKLPTNKADKPSRWHTQNPTQPASAPTPSPIPSGILSPRTGIGRSSPPEKVMRHPHGWPTAARAPSVSSTIATSGVKSRESTARPMVRLRSNWLWASSGTA